MAAEEALTVKPHLLEIDPANLIYGLNMGLLFIYGVTMYIAYPGAINADPAKFPARVSNACLNDREWALSTSEIRAWTLAAEWHAGVYGFGFFVWLWNNLAGNNGGYKHKLFYRTSQVLQIAPIVSLIMALNVKKSYAPNADFYEADIGKWE